MSIIIGPYFRGDPRAKPKQWGSIADVRSAIRHWFENIGLHLPFMYFPMWSSAVRNGEIVNFGSSSYTFGLNADTVVRDDFLDQNATDGGGLDSSASVDLSHTNQISIFMELIERYTGTDNRMLLEHSVTAGTNSNSFYVNMHEVNDHAVGYFDRDASDYRNNKVCPANSFPANTRQNFCIVNDRNQAADDTVAIYVQGVKQTLTTRYGYNQDTSGVRGNFNMYLGARNISTEEMWMDLFIFALFDEALYEDQVGILSDQPFAALQPRSAPIYSFVAGGTTVDCSLGQIAVTGLNAGISAGTTISCSLGQIAISALQAGISAGTTIACTTAAVTVTGQQAGISAGATIDCSLGAVSVSGLQASISTGASIDCSLGQVAISGLQAAISAGTTIACAVGQVSITGYQTDIETQGATINCSLGTVAIAGLSAGISAAKNVDCSLGQVAIGAYAAQIDQGITIECTTGAVIIGGLATDISAGRTISCTLSGIDVAGYQSSVISSGTAGGVVDVSISAAKPGISVSAQKPTVTIS